METVLKEYLATFEAPLPEDTISALAQHFKVDCQLTKQADDALAEIGGHFLLDSQESEVSPASHASLSTPPQASLAV